MVRLQGDFAKPPEKRFNYKHCFDALFRVSLYLAFFSLNILESPFTVPRAVCSWVVNQSENRIGASSSSCMMSFTWIYLGRLFPLEAFCHFFRLFQPIIMINCLP